MRKFVLKSLLALCLLVVGAVSWSPGSAADTVTPQPVTVILDNYQH